MRILVTDPRVLSSASIARIAFIICNSCLLYTSDAADERSSVDLGGRRIIKKKNTGDQATKPTTKENKQNTTTFTSYSNLVSNNRKSILHTDPIAHKNKP